MESNHGNKTHWTPEHQNTRHVGIYCKQKKNKKERKNMINEP